MSGAQNDAGDSAKRSIWLGTPDLSLFAMAAITQRDTGKKTPFQMVPQLVGSSGVFLGQAGEYYS